MAKELTTAKPKFPDTKIVRKDEIPLPTMPNALVALDALGVKCSYDTFHDRRYVAGHVLESHVGQVTDDVCLLIRALCRDRFGFDPGKDHTWDAVNLKCRLNSYHPVMNYLREIGEPWLWDGTPRIGTLLPTYFGVADSRLARAMSRLVMVASVRRIMQPGVKYDYMIVLVGPENKAKSLAIAKLYGEENFTDQKIIGISDKELAEALRGRWGVESAELAGLRKADIDHLKAQISRQTDRVRPAYGRAVVDVPRQCILWGTTNDPIFLRLAHGNRRLVPFQVGAIDIEGLERDRDQLWCEAVAAEAEHGLTLAMPPDVWAEAQAAQQHHTESDPWSDELADVNKWAAREAANARMNTRDLEIAMKEGKLILEPRLIPYDRNEERGDERITSWWLLAVALAIPLERRTAALTHRLSTVMQGLGWSEPRQMKIGGRNQRGYVRALGNSG